MARHATAWSVKGVDQATRDIARRAAQSAGMTIGEWIDHAIRAESEARGTAVPSSADVLQAAPMPASSPGGVRPELLDAVFRRLDDTDARFDATLRPIAYALHGVAERLVSLETRARRTPRLALPAHRAAEEAATTPRPSAPRTPKVPPTPESPPPDWAPALDLDTEALRRDAGPQPSPAARPAPEPPRSDIAPDAFVEPPMPARSPDIEQPAPAEEVSSPTAAPRRGRGWLWALLALLVLSGLLVGAAWYGSGRRFDQPTLERKLGEVVDSVSTAGEAAWVELEGVISWLRAEGDRLLGEQSPRDGATEDRRAEERAAAPELSPAELSPAEPSPAEPSPAVPPRAVPSPPPAAPVTPTAAPPTVMAVPSSPPMPQEAATADTAPAPTEPPTPAPGDTVAAVAVPPPSPALAPPTSSGRPAGDTAVAQPTAREALLVKARSGDLKAQHDLAVALANADPPDYAEAAVWFREAAINGIANAQYNLGVLHETGTGVAADPTRALLWYHSAAEQGHPLAQYNLGVLYAAGRGIPQSYIEAGRWFRRAAERGVPGASYNLAVMAHQGLGRPADAAAAEQLFRRAAALGHAPALAWLRAQGEGGSGTAPSLGVTETTAVDAALGADEIAEIQQGLLDRGFYQGAVDGIAGPRTRAAISQYQAAEGVPVTGLPSAGLAARLLER